MRHWMIWVAWLALAVFILWATDSLPAHAQEPGTFTAQNETGQVLYQGGDAFRAFQGCTFWTVRDQKRACTWTHVLADGRRDALKIYNSSRTGVWEWVAPTKLENGDILTDLSHYLIYRQPSGGQPVVWAHIEAAATRAILPMGPEHYGACFWVIAVRQPATSPAVASDKSNSICMDAQGQPLPAT